MTAGTINNYTQKHKNDDDYADGVDDAIDEMMEEGEGDW